MPETASDCARQATTRLALALENVVVPPMRPSQTGITPTWASLQGAWGRGDGDANKTEVCTAMLVQDAEPEKQSEISDYWASLHFDQDPSSPFELIVGR